MVIQVVSSIRGLIIKLTTAKLANYIKENFTNNELLRVFDLANRRVIENGRTSYTKEEHVMIDKVRKTWQYMNTKGNMC